MSRPVDGRVTPPPLPVSFRTATKSPDAETPPPLPRTFKEAVNAEKTRNVSAQSRPKRTAIPTKPFCIRLSDAEREFLEARAGNKPLGTYMRQILLKEHAQKRRAVRKPHIEQTQYAALLAALGESRLSSNLNQLARHANTGTLDVGEETEQQLRDACAAIEIMRKNLLIALGLKTGSPQ